MIRSTTFNNFVEVQLNYNYFPLDTKNYYKSIFIKSKIPTNQLFFKKKDSYNEQNKINGIEYTLPSISAVKLAIDSTACILY